MAEKTLATQREEEDLPEEVKYGESTRGLKYGREFDRYTEEDLQRISNIDFLCDMHCALGANKPCDEKTKSMQRAISDRVKTIQKYYIFMAFHPPRK